MNVQNRIKRFNDKIKRSPKLAVVLVGDDPASKIYTSRKGDAAIRLGMEHETWAFDASITPQEVFQKIQELNADPAVDGILIQRPLPASFSEAEVVYWIDPKKDVDAFHPENNGLLQLNLPCLKPCTPTGIMTLLDHYHIATEGKIACVIGRSTIVGKPIATLLLQGHATVIQCHSRTMDLPKMTQQADILVVAAGRPEIVGAEHIKKNAVIIDVGIHRKGNGTLCGDVRWDAVQSIAGAATPVPGGVGPMTIAMLMQNTVQAAEWREEI